MNDRRPSGATSALATLRAGDRLGGYTIEHLLGVGGTACVYSATTREGRSVALKVLRDDRADDPESRRRFVQEARVGASLHHPNIVRFVDFGSKRNQLYLAMELVEGQSLWSWVEKAPPAADFLDVFDQIFDALAHAHARGVVHRDLKPDNILLEPLEGGRLRVRLVDFGVAQHRRDNDDASSEPSVVGTPEYMSPEQCLGSPTVSFASDLYSVGVMIFEIVSGHLPFGGGNTAATLVSHLRDPIPPLVPRACYVPDQTLELVIRRLLAREPSERYLTAAAARAALGRSRLRDRRESPTSPSAHRGKGVHRIEPPPVSAGLFLVSDPPFVDVRGELQDLQNRLQSHLENDPAPMAVLISGASGSGRSRFINELGARLQEGGFAQVWRMETNPGEPAIDAVRRTVREYYPLAIMHPDDQAIRLEEQLAQDGFHEAWELDWALALLRDNEPLDALSETPVWNLFGRLFAAAGRRQRLAMVVENIDYNDGDLLLRLQHLVPPETKFAPVLLAAFRSEAETLSPSFQHRLGLLEAQEHRFVLERRELSRLGLRDMQRFLQRAVAVSPSAATLLADRSDGNPSFALKILRSVITRFGGQVLDDPVLLDRALAELPVEIGEMLVERLESTWLAGLVPNPIFRALESLSYLGQRIPRSQALAMLKAEGAEAPAALLAEMLALPALGSILRDYDKYLRFEDRLTRSALMLRAERQGRHEQLHRLCVDIKLHHRQDDTENISDIAEHCIAAGMFERARTLFYNAALTQYSNNQLIEALRNVDGAIRTVERDPMPNAEALAQILLTRAELLSQLSRFSDAKKTLLALERLGVLDENSESRPQLLRLHAGVMANVNNDGAGARALLREAHILADRSSNLLESIRCRLALSGLNFNSGRFFEAEQLLHTVLKLNRQHEYIGIHAATFSMLGYISLFISAYEEARAYAKLAEDLFKKQSNRQGLANTQLLYGMIEHYSGNYHQAWDLLRRSQEEFFNIGDRRDAALAQTVLGAIADALGQTQRARACFEQALISFERFHDIALASICKLRLAALDAHEGHWRSAGERLLESLAQYSTDPMYEWSWSEAMLRMSKEAIMADRQALAKDLLERTHVRLNLSDNRSYVYDRIEEVAHLLYQLEA